MSTILLILPEENEILILRDEGNRQPMVLSLDRGRPPPLAETLERAVHLFETQPAIKLLSKSKGGVRRMKKILTRMGFV